MRSIADVETTLDLDDDVLATVEERARAERGRWVSPAVLDAATA